MLVMDENRNFNTTDEYVRQLQWFVRRDRNHPSVILWSIFNEEPFQGTEQGFEMVRHLAALVKQLDKTRPITAAQSSGMLNPINASLAADVAGFNYQQGTYDDYHAAHPEKPVISSEDTSAVMTRGEYTTDKQGRFVIDSYDDQHQPWGADHRTAWHAIATRPFVAGTFVWTGFDYRGEPQPLGWPSTGSSFGIMDQCGFPKSAFFIHEAQWVNDRPVLYLIPHWNFAGNEAKPVKVMAISNADEVELKLNDKLIGRKSIDPINVTATWDVPYEAGKLEATGFKGGKEVSRFVVETTGNAVALQLVPDRANLVNDGRDAMPVTVQAIDAQGRVVPTAHPLAIFKIEGPCVILGVANGDPICHEPDKADRRSLYNGLAQVILQSTGGDSQPITLTANADGLKPASVTITPQPGRVIASVPAEPPATLLRHWQISPATAARPDPNQQVNKTDMNTYGTLSVGKPQALVGGHFALLRATFTAHADVARKGGRMIFKDFAGKAEVFIDGKPVGLKTDPATATFEVPVAPGDEEHHVVVIVESPLDQPVGLGGMVTVTNAGVSSVTQ
jgi:beta-galactosidase